MVMSVAVGCELRMVASGGASGVEVVIVSAVLVLAGLALAWRTYRRFKAGAGCGCGCPFADPSCDRGQLVDLSVSAERTEDEPRDSGAGDGSCASHDATREVGGERTE